MRLKCEKHKSNSSGRIQALRHLRWLCQWLQGRFVSPSSALAVLLDKRLACPVLWVIYIFCELGIVYSFKEASEAVTFALCHCNASVTCALSPPEQSRTKTWSNVRHRMLLW